MKFWHPDWQLFLSGHLRAAVIGKQGWEGRTKVGGLRLAPSPLGKHASSLSHRLLFKNEQGVSDFVWNKDEEMTLSCPHKTKQNNQPLQSQRDFHPRQGFLSRVHVPLQECLHGWYLQHTGAGDILMRLIVFTFYKNTQSQTLLLDKAALLYECFLNLII